MAKNTEQKITVLCGNTEFEFPLSEKDDSWYCLDGRKSVNGDESLELKADRDVYAVYTDKNGTAHYGTVGDKENEILADNEGINSGDRFIFYEKPEAKDKYL